jgi:hypothetical protein
VPSASLKVQTPVHHKVSLKFPLLQSLSIIDLHPPSFATDIGKVILDALESSCSPDTSIITSGTRRTVLEMCGVPVLAGHSWRCLRA